MDQPPQSSRSSLNEPHQATQGPIPVFDTHLKYLTESYLSFFQERYVLVSALHLQCEYVFMFLSLCFTGESSKKHSAYHLL